MWAFEREDKLWPVFEWAREDLAKRLGQHSDAKAKLAETNEQLKRLEQAKTELVRHPSPNPFSPLLCLASMVCLTCMDKQDAIFNILDNSTGQLAILKEHVSQLVQFFNAILGEVFTGVEQDVKDFLEPITRGARVGDDWELDGFNIRKTRKKVR
jgi:hypothetical protein